MYLTVRRRLPDWPRGMREDLAAAYVGLSVTTLHAERRAGRFPQPILLTERRVIYLREDLDAYLDKRAGRARGLKEANPWDSV